MLLIKISINAKKENSYTELFTGSFLGILYVFIMRNFLNRRFDSLLFREPWFTIAELTLYTSWPFSFIKSTQYMFLVSLPNYARKRRFKGVDMDLDIDNSLRVACNIYTVIHLLAAFFLISSVLFIIAIYVIDHI